MFTTYAPSLQQGEQWKISQFLKYSVEFHILLCPLDGPLDVKIRGHE